MEKQRNQMGESEVIQGLKSGIRYHLWAKQKKNEKVVLSEPSLDPHGPVQKLWGMHSHC